MEEMSRRVTFHGFMINWSRSRHFLLWVRLIFVRKASS